MTFELGPTPGRKTWPSCILLFAAAPAVATQQGALQMEQPEGRIAPTASRAELEINRTEQRRGALVAEA